MKQKRHFVFRSILLSSLLLYTGYTYVFWNLPSMDSLSQDFMRPSVRITDRRGELLYEIIPENGGRNTVLSIAKIPQCMKDATVAVEDKTFYTNPGIDMFGMLRAAWINVSGGETVAGGSTITQQ